jgi:beta-glucosidase
VIRDSEIALRFPENFLWGSATASHQVEGWNYLNDWWIHEQAGRLPFQSGVACEQLQRYGDDFQLMRQLGHNAHRLSIEWSRIEPRIGEFDHQAIDHYRRVVESVRANGLEPLVTLHHFTSPAWLARGGGWTRSATPELFARYVRQVVSALKDIVQYWVTINEPTVYTFQGYVFGVWPPHRYDPVHGIRVMRTMALAHGRAYHAIHDLQPDAQVGVAHHWRVFDPYRSGHVADVRVANTRDWINNQWFPLAIRTGQFLPPLGRGRKIDWLANTEDWVGVNYYTREFCQFAPGQPLAGFSRDPQPKVERNQLGWEIYPEGLYRSLMAAAPPGSGKRIIVTENGVPEAGDSDVVRPRYLVQHLAAAHRALQEGVKLEGYCYWSSIDNFEWAEGFAPRFGLVHVDYATQERTPKPSAKLYRDIIRRGGITTDELERFQVSVPD